MHVRRLRLLLLLDAAAIAVGSGALVLLVGLPLAAQGGLRAAHVALLAVTVSVAAVVLGGLLLVRWVGRPVARILDAAAALGTAVGDLPLLEPPGEAGGQGLSRAAVAFERAGTALAQERARLADKVADLEAVNAQLVRARESLFRAEQLATLGRLASGVAHEVGNPLGAITGYVELARARLRGAPSPEVEDLVVRIGAEATRIDAIVRDLLDFARPAPLALRAVEIGAAIDAAVRLATVQGRFRDVAVEVEIAPALRVLADERRLSQVLLNLLLNAADAMGGRGRVRISGREVGGTQEVEIAIRDTGPGIAPEHLPMIFEPFFTTKPPGQGTGLGLAVCHGIVASFGGRITAENAEGGGAAFRLVLQRAVAAGP